MGADLFESYVGSIIGSMVLGSSILVFGFSDINFVLLPLYIAAAGILVSILGHLWFQLRRRGPTKALNIGEFGSAVFMVAFTYVLIINTLPASFSQSGVEYTSLGVFYATLIGLLAGLGIGLITEHYTGTGTGPVKSIVEQSITGPATNIISGLSVGMQSTAFPILVLSAAILEPIILLDFMV